MRRSSPRDAIMVAVLLAPALLAGTTPVAARRPRAPIADDLPVPIPRPTKPKALEIKAPETKTPETKTPDTKTSGVKAPAAPSPTAPSGAAIGPARPPAEDSGCLAKLQARHVTVDPLAIPQQPDARCTVAEAVKLEKLDLSDGTSVTFPDAPTIACVTADVFSAYVAELLAPLVKGSYGVALASVSTGPGLECRPRDHIVGAKLSAHGQGLAIDIAQMVLSDRRVIAVGAPTTGTDRAFEAGARAAGCGYFHTALGPGADPYHRTHWHFDLEPRGGRGDGKFCQ